MWSYCPWNVRIPRRSCFIPQKIPVLGVKQGLIPSRTKHLWVAMNVSEQARVHLYVICPHRNLLSALAINSLITACDMIPTFSVEHLASIHNIRSLV